MRVATMVLLGLTANASADRAFDSNAPTPPPPVVQRPVCAEGRPIKQCATVALIEIGFAQGKATEGNRRATGRLPVQLGILINVSDHAAIGATAGLVAYNTASSMDPPDANNVDASFGAFFRYRRWLVESASVDISVGGASNGVIAEVALQLDDLLAITAGVHQFPFDDHREVAGTIGVRLGGYAIAALIALAAH